MPYKTVAIEEFGLHFSPAVQSEESDLEHRLFQQKVTGYFEGRIIEVWFSLINEG